VIALGAAFARRNARENWPSLVRCVTSAAVRRRSRCKLEVIKKAPAPSTPDIAAAAIQMLRWARKESNHGAKSADTSTAEAYRLAALFSSVLRITRSSLPGTPCLTADGFAGDSVSREPSTPAGVLPLKGRRPVVIS